jgi:hypothetical protein
MYFSEHTIQTVLEVPQTALSANRTVKFLKLSRSQTRQVTGLLTGHCHLKGHLFKLGIIDSPCEKYHMETETASHILCECVN